MELSIPLTSFDCSSNITVSKQSTYYTGVQNYHTVVVSPSQNWFVVSDNFQSIICNLDTAEQYTIKGALFFRLNEYGYSTLSLLNYGGNVDDFSDAVSPSLPLQCPTSNVHINSGGEIVSVVFLASDGVVLFSYSGYIGFVWLDTKELICTGYSMRCGNLKNICCGSILADSLAVVLTCEGFFGVMALSDGSMLAMATEPVPSNAGLLKSFVLMQGTAKNTINVISTFSISGEICNIVLPLEKCENHLDEKIGVSQRSLKYSSFFPANSYVKKFKSYNLIFSVWGDRAVLSVLKNTELSTLYVIENEMNIPYVSGCWVDSSSLKGEGDVFVITRADGIAFPFLITFDDEEQTDGCRILPQRHLTLKSSTSALLRGLSDYYSLLAVSSMNSLWNNDTGSLSITDSQDDTHLLLCSNKIPKESEILYVDFLPFRSSIAFLTIKRSGSCTALVPSESNWETVFLANEMKSATVTSYLLYERQSVIFVTGHEDGSMNVWVSGKLECTIRTVHTGAIDKILFLSGEKKQELCDFISVCTLKGTVAIHHSETFQRTHTLTSPWVPLDRLVWDPCSEYIYAISGSRGNLWHVPTYHLERTFDTDLLRSSQCYKRRNLLEPSSSTGPVKIARIVTCGAIYHSLVLDVPALLNSIYSVTTADSIHSSCKLALSILFSESSVMNTKLLAQFVVPQQLLRETHLKRCVVGAGQSVTYNITVILLISVLQTALGVPHVVSSEEICRISQYLVDSKHIETFPKLEMMIMHSLPLLIQLPNYLRETVRFFLAAAVRRLSSSRLEVLLKDLNSLLAEEVRVRHWFGVKNTFDNFGFWCYSLFARVTIVAEVANEEMVVSTVEMIKDGVPQILRALKESEYRCNIHIPLFLKTLGDYYTFFRTNVFEDCSTLIDGIACIAFEEEHPDALNALVNIAIIEGISFLESRVDNWYNQRRLWRPSLISFLGEFIECAPVQSFNYFHVMTDFITRALDPHNPNKEERSACLSSVTKIIRLAVKCLPNVSFQQNLQFLAVGNKDGKITVINLKTTGIVASFVSHTEPILCVAYSSDTSSHNVAAIGENLDTLKIWRANIHTNVFSAIFSGPTLEFVLRHVIEIPAMEKCTPVIVKRDLLITTTKLRWLSPHCVELSSLRHDKIQFAVQ